MLPMIAGLVACVAGGAEKMEAPAIGAEVPGFTMNATDGKEHSLSDYRGKIVVLDFSSQHCPWSRAADPDISRVAAEYADKDVVFLSIDSHSSTSLDDIKPYVEEQELVFAVLKDDGNAYADTMGAKQTPEIYIVDKEGKLAYHGAWDNRRSPDQVGEVNYVTNALDALLEGREVEESKTKAWGCTIKRAS